MQLQVKDKRLVLVIGTAGHADKQVMTLGTNGKQEFMVLQLCLHNILSQTLLPKGCNTNRVPSDSIPSLLLSPFLVILSLAG